MSESSRPSSSNSSSLRPSATHEEKKSLSSTTTATTTATAPSAHSRQATEEKKTASASASSSAVPLPPPTSKNLVVSALNSLKIAAVIRYVVRLVRDLSLNNGKLKNEKKDLPRRLLGMVWPEPTLRGMLTPGSGGVQVLGMVVLAIARTFLMNQTSALIHALTTCVYSRDKGKFQKLAKQGLIVSVFGAALNAVYSYNKDTLALLWRQRLTKIIHDSYFSRMGYYHIANLPAKTAILDTDERITRELIGVSNRLANVLSMLVSSLPPLFWFTYKLWKWRGFKYAMVPHLYLLLAFEIAQRLFPKNIGELARAQAIAVGTYNKAATRLQTHAESIVALGGTQREAEILQSQFVKVEQAAANMHTATSKFGLVFKLAYTYGCRSWITSFMMIPTLRSALVYGLPSGVGYEVGQIRLSWQLMIEMLVASGNLLTLHATAEHMSGTCRRILQLIDTLRELQVQQKQIKATSFQEDQRIAFEHVQVHTPAGVMLIKDLSFEVEKGGRLLLTGHNGAGKSSIFRCLGGLWPIGEGVVVKPGASTTGLHQDIYYLPQKPYNVLGTLRDQLTYPQPKEEVKLSQSELESLLKLVNLSHLLSVSSSSSTASSSSSSLKEGEADDALLNWEDRLSLGEQQRLAIARLLYHKPKFAILDECTSAVTHEMEEMLYERCKEMGIAYITICHRPTLKQYHDVNLNLTGDGKGGWELLQIDHSQDPPSQKRDTTLVVGGGDASARERTLQERSAKYLSPAAHATKKIKKRSALSKVLLLGRVMLPGSRKKLLLLLGVICLRTLCHESYSFLIGKLFRAMVERDIKTFALLSMLNIFQDFFTGIIEEGVIYLQNKISAQWYTSLSQFLMKHFFEKNNFFTMRFLDKRVKDADQRITAEAADLAAAFSEIWAKAISPVVDIVWFSARLYMLLGAAGMRSMATFIVASACILRLALPNHERLNSKEKKLESQFKFIHSRLCVHAESVAFFGGDEAERAIADRSFESLAQHTHNVRLADAKYKFVFNSINKDFDAPASLLNAPDLLTIFMQLQHASQEGGNTQGLTTESFYIRSVADRTLAAFGKLSGLYESISKLLASSTRVCEMIDVMTELEQRGEQQEEVKTATNTTATTATVTYPPSTPLHNLTREGEGLIQMQDVDLVTPDGLCLASDITLTVPAGEGLLVTGPNGYGKTSFFRVLAGLWPLRAGRILRPTPNDLVLVPQKAYSVSGSLADQVTYPKRIFPRTPEQEAKMLAVLEQVGISFLVAREKGWDTVKPWENTLSLGEQQRMGLARLLFTSPKFGVLDECTDAVSADAEIKLYEALNAAGVSCITISKRLALTEFHSQELRLDNNAQGWTLKSLR